MLQRFGGTRCPAGAPRYLEVSSFPDIPLTLPDMWRAAATSRPVPGRAFAKPNRRHGLATGLLVWLLPWWTLLTRALSCHMLWDPTCDTWRCHAYGPRSVHYPITLSLSTASYVGCHPDTKLAMSLFSYGMTALGVCHTMGNRAGCTCLCLLLDANGSCVEL